MSAKSLPCTYFDTPEGRWTLASEFTTEDAANQFLPHIGRDSGADDLSLGASGTEHHQPLTNGSNSGIRFSAASSAMASGGLMFSADASPQVSSRATSAVTASIPKSNLHMLANRPTQVSIFRVPELAAPVANSGAEAGVEGTSNSSSVAGSKGHSFRQGRLYLSKAAGALGSSSGALQSLPGTASTSAAGAATPSSAASASQTTTSAAANTTSPAHSKGIVTKSTSAYVSRIVTNENLARWLVGDNQHSTYLLFNAPRCMAWVGLQPESSGETLARFDLVSNTPLCHAINEATRGENRLDMVMGFVHGNIIWYDPISGKYARLNKNSGYTAAIVSVRWIPGSASLFMAGTADGCVMIMDRNKEDFSVPALAHSNRPVTAMDAFEVAPSLKPKCNPVAFWKVGNKPITCMAFSPDGCRVAIGSEDGGLRIVDYLNEILEDVYLSYFAGITCCAWSDDGKYVVAGGKDDLITVWGFDGQSVVARCQGHESWVRDIAFDPMGTEDTYRFMSVGDDAKLLVWDFSLSALHRPRATVNRVHLQGCPGVSEGPSDTVHPRLPRAAVPVLQPLMAVAIHDAPICSLQFSQDLLVTACRKGVVKVWKRPAVFDLALYI
ncbi:hypothetical protein GGI20_001772 [Coemansia sp. BCRC 34301]|nr:hypothetical protein GGI20_001772 [Coemansia sp. BCRC 34301]